MTYDVILLSRTVCGGLVGTFRFARPLDYVFSAGQHLSLGLVTKEGLQKKVFTIASAPADDYLEICTRLSDSAFKTALLALPEGARVEISPPSGRLSLASGGSATGFLVGGVGVTPARSFVRDAMMPGRSERIILFFGDRSPECMTYADEFADLAERVDRLVYVPVVEHPDTDWNGEVGFITADVVRRHLADPAAAGWIISGPPVMVQAMRGVAASLGIPDVRLQVELFSGYPSPGDQPPSR